jgi:transcriptional regulator with XRE-family HTH domain
LTASSNIAAGKGDRPVNFAAKISRLTKEKGWKVKYLAEVIGTTTAQLSRWKIWANDPHNAKQFEALKAGRPAQGFVKVRGSYPGRIELLRLAHEFDVDLEWLIDDNQGWDDRPQLVGVVAQRIKKLSPAEALHALELYAEARRRP